MAVYDFSGGLGLLGQGIDSLGASLKTANQQTQSVALAHALATGDWTGAMQAAAEAGDTNTVLKLRELKQSNDQAAAFNTQLPEAIKALYPGGTGAAGSPLAAAGTGGSPADQVSRAILGQESGGNPNIRDSPDGAKGIGQIMPATFAQYAKPGEVITNPTDNYNVHQRIIQDYAQRYNNDPRRMAVAYFSGPGNVASPESPTPWIRNSRDGGGQSVAGYVNGIMSRLGSGRSATGTPSALLGGGAGETQPVVRAADGTTYSGPNATAAVAADTPSPSAAPVSGTAPGSLANSLASSVAPPLPPSRPADLGSTADPAVVQFLASHVGPQNAAKLLQAPPETPVSTLVQPGDVPPDDMVKTAGQLVAEARQALQGGMAHGTSTGLGLTLDAPRIAAPVNVPPLSSVAPVAGYGDEAPRAPRAPAPALPVRPQLSSILPPAPMDATGGAPQTPGSPASIGATGGAPPPVPATPRSTPIYPYGSATPAVGLPPPSAPAAPIAAGTSPDIAAIERTMPAVQQQAASVGGGQVNDAGMAAASALTSGRPVPQGLGASLAAPVISQLSPGGAPPALAGAPPQAAPVISQLAPAPDASGSTPPAEAPGAMAATPPPAAAPSTASPNNPDPPVMIGGRTWTREQADNDSSASSPSVADVAKAQGITGDIAQDESPKDIADGLKSGEYKYGGAAPALPIDAKLPPTPAAIKAGDPPVEAAAKVAPPIARSLAQTRPGSDQRMMLFALLMRAAANSGPQSAGNVKFVEGLMGIEKQHQEDFQKAKTILTPQELAAIPNFTPKPNTIYTRDAWGNIEAGPEGAKPPEKVLTPEQATAEGYGPVLGPHSIVVQSGDGTTKIVSKPKEETPPSVYVPVISLADRRAQGILDSDKKPYRLDISTNKLEPVGGGGQTINIGDKEFMKVAIGKLSTGETAAREGAIPALVAANRMQENLDKGIISGFGPAQPAAKFMAEIFAKMGLGNPELVGNTQKYMQSAMNEWVPLARAYFPQRVTNADLTMTELMSGTNPANTKAAIQLAIDVARERARRIINNHNQRVDKFISSDPEANTSIGEFFRIDPTEAPEDAPKGSGSTVKPFDKGEVRQGPGGTTIKMIE